MVVCSGFCGVGRMVGGGRSRSKSGFGSLGGQLFDGRFQTLWIR